MKILSPLAAIALSVSVAACSSNSTSNLSSDNLPAKYSDLASVVGKYEAGTLSEADASLMSGTVAMNGVIGVEDPSNSDGSIIGDLALTANFNDDTISGTASDFGVYDAKETKTGALGGSLTVSGAAGSISGTSVTANVAGTLTDSGDSISVSGQIDGKFYDDSGKLASGGDFTATATGSDFTDNLSGGYVVTAN